MEEKDNDDENYVRLFSLLDKGVDFLFLSLITSTRQPL